ncbi:MAG TPA: hypothetical protein VIX12_00385, partial [Candidatus Binataceae bacterium]
RFPPLQTAEIEAILATHGMDDPKRASAIARLSRGSAARALALAEGDEPPLDELLKALKSGKSADFAAAQEIAQSLFSNRGPAVDNFELIARLLEEILCYKLLKADFAAYSKETATAMAELAQGLTIDGILRCLDAAVKAAGAIEAMANPRLQAEQWWMTAADALRGEN